MPMWQRASLFDDIPELRDVETRGEHKNRGIKSFVLRAGHLHQFQLDALHTFYPVYGIPFSKTKISFSQVFGNNNPTIIEIGFGMGDSTALIAKNQPDVNFLGIEVFLSGFAKLLHEAGTIPLPNMRLMRFDAVEVLETMIEDNSVAGFHIFFPDPWPKKKHNKRRLIQLPFTTLLARKLKPGGYIYAVTDWKLYADEMLEVFEKTPKIINMHGGFAPPVSWRPQTKFEAKGLAKDYTISEVWVEKPL